jgi:hypothetical protein
MDQEKVRQGKGITGGRDNSKKGPQSLICHFPFLIMYTGGLRNVHKKGVYVGYVDTVDFWDAYTVMSDFISISEGT